jgi:hypothetical protein
MVVYSTVLDMVESIRTRRFLIWLTKIGCPWVSITRSRVNNFQAVC